MALKLIRLEPKLAKAVLVVLALATLVCVWFFARWYFANAFTARLDAKRPETKLVVDWLIGLAPSDPQGHQAAAYVLETTFDPKDLQRSLEEYEQAAALAPNNYVAWLNLARSRNLNGDPAGAEAAFARAIELAPEYASVQWAYGNFLIRNGRDAEGFQLIAKAAASGDYARVAVTTALQIFDGNVASVREKLGGSDAINSALVAALGSSERFDEAVETWSAISPEARNGKLRKTGEKLVEQLAAAKRYRLVSSVVAGMQPDEALRPSIGHMLDGGFESELKLRGAGVFDWQIAEGSEPQIGQSDSQKRSGKLSLLMIFNSFEAAQFRSVSQLVAVEPGAEYEFEGFYRYDVKTPATMKIEIANAATGAAIASSPPFALAGDWASLHVKFAAPKDADGVLVRLVREGCVGPACRVAGRLSLDDFAIRKL